MSPEPMKMNHHAASEPLAMASEPAEPCRLALSGPSMVALKPIETGRPTPSEPSAAPPESAGAAVLIRPSPPSRGRAQSGNVPTRSNQGQSSWPQNIHI